MNKGSAVRFAFAAAIFGDISEALFWLQLPQALHHSLDKSSNKYPKEASQSISVSEAESVSILNRIASRERSVAGKTTKDTVVISIA